MKRRPLSLIAALSLLCIYASAQQCSLNPTIVFSEKDNMQNIVKQYYANLSLAADPMNDDKEREQFKTQVMESFETPECKISSDLPDKLPQPNYTVLNYINEFCQACRQGVQIYDTLLGFTDVYPNDPAGSYIIVANVKRTIVAQDNSVDEKLVDLWFTFDDNKHLHPKITSVQLHDPAYFGSRAPVTICSGDNVQKISNQAYLVLNATPLNATVLIDSVNTPYSRGVPIPIKKGNRTVDILADGYQPAVIYIMAADTGTVVWNRPLTNKSGKLTITTKDPLFNGLEVFIDDYSVGNIPLTDYSLGFGIHKILVKNNGYHEYVRKIKLTEDHVSNSLVVDFKPIQANGNNGSSFFNNVLVPLPPAYQPYSSNGGRYGSGYNSSGNTTSYTNPANSSSPNNNSPGNTRMYNTGNNTPNNTPTQVHTNNPQNTVPAQVHTNNPSNNTSTPAQVQTNSNTKTFVLPTTPNATQTNNEPSNTTTPVHVHTNNAQDNIPYQSAHTNNTPAPVNTTTVTQPSQSNQQNNASQTQQYNNQKNTKSTQQQINNTPKPAKTPSKASVGFNNFLNQAVNNNQQNNNGYQQNNRNAPAQRGPHGENVYSDGKGKYYIDSKTGKRVPVY
jgi:hypothetical protein